MNSLLHELFHASMDYFRRRTGRRTATPPAATTSPRQTAAPTLNTRAAAAYPANAAWLLKTYPTHQKRRRSGNPSFQCSTLIVFPSVKHWSHNSLRVGDLVAFGDPAEGVSPLGTCLCDCSAKIQCSNAPRIWILFLYAGLKRNKGLSNSFYRVATNHFITCVCSAWCHKIKFYV